ncbi:MAG: cobyrinate a,c-diamide synthase [Rhodospirillales bacterium]|nr:cobyrinate a,c-diamide synthase [Rhodospirillales bacterium]
MNRLFISALHKSSGKTTVSIGLSAALTARGQKVQPFKKGPDYIDPMWLGKATGRDCINLDFHTMGHGEMVEAFNRHAQGADLSIVEGNKGLFDGVDVEGSDSNAALAAMLQTPVVLVLDTRGMTRGVAPVIQGYQSFGQGLIFAGIILNHVGGPRHEGKLRAALERYTDVPVIGALGRYPQLEIKERHLGLTPANEASKVTGMITEIAKVMEENVDVARFRQIAEAAPAFTATSTVPAPTINSSRAVRIGVARDSAFGFYYPDDLQALENAGATLVPFNTMSDDKLPQVDGLFIGGGFPETHAKALADNTQLRTEIKGAIEQGLPTYAECGGLMYLSKSLTWNGETHEMVGVVPGNMLMHEKPVGRGYVKLEETGKSPWGIIGNGEVPLPVHEFHYASMEDLPPNMDYAFAVKRGHGIDGQNDGLILGNLVAGFSHHRQVAGNRWAERFVEFVKANKQQITLEKTA